jgi:hypothetical protein
MPPLLPHPTLAMVALAAVNPQCALAPDPAVCDHGLTLLEAYYSQYPGHLNTLAALTV